MEKGLAILVHSVRQVFGNLAAAVRISGVLFAVIAVISVLGTPADPASAGSNLGLLLILAIVSVLISLWIAVAWHRYVLLREGGNTPLPAFRGDAIGRYFVNGLLVALIMIPMAVVLGIAAAGLFGAGLAPEASPGQSLGAFAAPGLKLEVVGDANDYVGKGLSGATIVVAPRAKDRHRASGDAIIGNTCLYGATSGKLFASGTAGVRFAVRNSGAQTVVEGCGANGCEYMTGGRAVILGPVGDNFGAGMTGGAAFVWDPEAQFERVANADGIDWYPLGDMPQEHIDTCKALIEEHAERTGSVRAEDILGEWDTALQDIQMIVPKEIATLLLGKTKPKARKKA